MEYSHEDMIWRGEAVETVQQVRERALTRQASESVPIDRLAGRTLTDHIVASGDVPAHDHATMDGYAFDATNDYPLAVREDEIFPESEPPSIEAGEAVEIATGAPLPLEANAVLKREESEIEDGNLTGVEIDPGMYTYKRGSNMQAGEQLFHAGERLATKDAILLGDLGYSEVTVFERFSTGVLATGTEIHENRQEDLDSPMLIDLIRSWGHKASYERTVPDDYDQVKDTIATLAAEYDVVLTTGGTSVGHKDFVIRALADLGELQFHRVRIRPGKPIAVADLDDAVAFAIPGKPLGAYTISTLVMRPFFTGRTDLPTREATLSSDVNLGPEGFEYAVPVTIEGKEAMPLGHIDSPLQVYEETFDPSVLSSSTRATRADGLVLTQDDLATSEPVDVVPYPVVE